MADLDEKSPEELERDIERTRAELRDDVEALQEKLSPAAAARRGADRVQETVHQVRETIMGSTSDLVSSARESAQEGVGRANESIRGARTSVQRTARGNPLAVGLAAFALGWLVSSLIPATKPERRAARAITESDAVEEIAAPFAESARTVAHEAAEHARSAAADVGHEAQSTASGLASSSSGPGGPSAA